MEKRGRPVTYNAQIAAAICERLSAAESLRSICEDDGMPPEATVRGWVTDDREGFAAQYARARDAGLDKMADEVLQIADDASRDWVKVDGKKSLNAEHVQRSRLRFDARRWYLSKLAPKRYGDVQRVEHSGSVDVAAVILEARKRSGG